MEIVNSLKNIINENTRLSFHQAVVVAHHNSPKRADIRLSGGTDTITGVLYIHSYAPQVDDIVFVLINNNDILILGDIAT